MIKQYFIQVLKGLFMSLDRGDKTVLYSSVKGTVHVPWTEVIKQYFIQVLKGLFMFLEENTFI